MLRAKLDMMRFGDKFKNTSSQNWVERFLTKFVEFSLRSNVESLKLLILSNIVTETDELALLLKNGKKAGAIN